MQNKSAIWTFIILLAAACIYSISFTFKNASVDSAALNHANDKIDSLSTFSEFSELQKDSLSKVYKDDYLKSKQDEKFLGIFTPSDVRKKQINKGLDLQGGMNVTLEVSLIDLVRNLAVNKDDPTFKAAIQKAQLAQKNSGDDFITLFTEAFTEIDPNAQLAAIFHSRNNKELFAPNATNDEVIATLKEEAEAAVSRTEQVIRKRIDNLGVVQPKVQRLESGRILVELPGVKQKERVRKILQGTAKLEFWETYDNTEMYPKFAKADELIRKKALLVLKETEDSTSNPVTDVADQAEVIIENTVDSTQNALESLLGETDATEEDSTENEEAKVKGLFNYLAIFYSQEENRLFEGARVGYAQSKDTALINAYLNEPDISILFPRTKLFWTAKEENLGSRDDPFYASVLVAVRVKHLDGNPPMDGAAVSSARQDLDQYGNPSVSLTMTPDGTRKWATLTGENVGKSIAIVLDNKIYSYPNVNGAINGGNTEISGSFDIQEAQDLASVLKAGKLPVPSKIIEEAIVGPSLGEKNVNASFKSFLLALGLVLIYMILYYARAGVVANIALLANIFFVIGVLASLGATLTLPGVAGIVLTIGMALDANILFFERVREEMRNGASVKLAINKSYSWEGALPSIIDANVTSFLTALILLFLATGPVQGFATTLLIGIITSLVSAIFITRLIFEWMLSKKMDLNFETGFSKGLFTNLNIDFIEKRKIFYVVSAVLIVISLGSLFTKGLDLGVDFSGGRTFQLKFEEPVNPSEVSSLLGEAFIENGIRNNPEVKTYGASNQLLVTTKFMIDDNSIESSDIVEGKLREGLLSIGNEFEIMSSQKVGPTIADDIMKSSLYATVLALIMIFLYIAARFKKIQFGAGAIAALFHDVIIVLGLYSVLYGILPFSLEIDQAFIAAILTVVGYSVNDTVVIFDRIREYLGIYRKDGRNKTVNRALNSTLTRTFNTSITTFIVLFLIFLFGGESIQGFVFAIMIGVVVGTYSSLFIATPVMLDLDKSDSLRTDAILKNESAKKKKKKKNATKEVAS